MNRGYMKNTVIKTIALITIVGLMPTTYTHAMKRKSDEIEEKEENKSQTKKPKIISSTDNGNDWPFLTKKKIEEKMKEFITFEKNGEEEEKIKEALKKEESMIKKFIRDEYQYKCFCADKLLTHEQGAVVLRLSKDQNDKDSKFFIITSGDLFCGECFSGLKKLIDFTELRIYIFKLDYLVESKEEIQKKIDTLSNNLCFIIPNIKNLEIKAFGCTSTSEDKLTFPLITSLLNKKWNLSNISIDLDSNFITSNKVTKILNHLSNITSLQSVELFGPRNKTIINSSGLKNIAEHDLIKKTISLKLQVNPGYIDVESFEKSKYVFQKNMAANTTITLNNFPVTKEEEKAEEEIGWSFFTKKEPEAYIKFFFPQKKALKSLKKEDSFIGKYINFKDQGVPNILDKTAVVLSLHENKNDLNPKFVSIKLSELFNKKLFCDRRKLDKITQVCIYIFESNRNDITEMKSEMQQRINEFCNNIYSAIPNVKSLKIKYPPLSNNNPNIPLITSLLNVKWNLSNVSIYLNSKPISDRKAAKILNQLLNITSLQSVKLFDPENEASIGFSGLKNIAEHAFIKNLISLKLQFHPSYIDEENFEEIKNLFQKNMSSNTTISLNDLIITKQEEKDLAPKITMPSVNIDMARKEYTEKYEINLMWINKDIRDFLAFNKEKTQEFINTALKWAEKNPEATIIIWYDSEFITTPEAAIKNSGKLIKDKPKNEHIVFKDIRELDLVKQHQSVFSNKLPVYFRADLLREIIAFEMLNSNETNCFMYADVDIKPMTKKQLFDDETIYYLKKYGLILARTSGGSYENGFQMIVKNDIAIKAIKDILIDFPIALAESYLNPSAEQLNLKSKNNNIYEKSFRELIYYTFPQMFKYFYFLKNKIIAKKDICSDSIIKNAIEEFWNSENISDGEVRIPWSKIISGKKVDGFHLFFPTKIVTSPPISGEYY